MDLMMSTKSIEQSREITKGETQITQVTIQDEP
jgi:hypothetical protein